MQLQDKFEPAMSAELTKAETATHDTYNSPEWQVRVDNAPSDDITFKPADESRAVTPEDVGYASVGQVVANVQQMFDHDQQDRFSFDMI